jgi:hypothetical protein
VRLLAVLALVAALPGATPAEEAESLGEALEEGQLSLGLRYRFEHVDEDAFDETGDASTLRTLLGYQTRPFHGVSATLRLSNVTDLGTLDRYDDAGSKQAFGLKAAFYDAESFSTDTSKVWAWSAWSF